MQSVGSSFDHGSLPVSSACKVRASRNQLTYVNDLRRSRHKIGETGLGHA
jgi:hypothetical protein